MLTAKKGDRPGYYLNIAPREVFVAGGIWRPGPENLVQLRRYVSANGNELFKILGEKNFKKTFGGLNTDQVLKRPPKGFALDHAFIELLKFKIFTVSCPLHPDDVSGPGFAKKAEKYFKLMKPLNDFIDRGLTV